MRWCFIGFFGAMAAFGCGSETSDDDNNIACIRQRADGTPECWQWKDRAEEGCDGVGEERPGLCRLNGFPHACEGTNPPTWVKQPNQCPPE
jgi:hypothetical protein